MCWYLVDVTTFKKSQCSWQQFLYFGRQEKVVTIISSNFQTANKYFPKLFL